MRNTIRKPVATNSIRVAGINLEWHPRQGTCTFDKLPVAMMWVDTTLAGLMSGVQTMVGTERFVLALQSEGRKSVEADWQVISKFPDFRDGFQAIANIAAVAGWGHWALTSIDGDQKECHFRIADSWEGRYQRALGVCWGSGMLAGKLAGYCSKLFGTNCWADQTAFTARGDDYDEFIVKPSPRSIEKEIDSLLATDEATRADMAVALRRLEKEIAERTLAEAERLEMERRLLHAQKLESLGILSGGIAHDFNNLLMAVIGNLDLALLDLSPASAARPYLDQALQATRRGADLTRQMLAYSGKGRFVITRMDLSDVVRENTTLFRTAISKTVTMNLRLNRDCSVIEADPGQVQQVIMNLITNASEAIEENVGVLTLTTGVQEFDDAYLSKSRSSDKPPAGRYAYVEVSDTGCGMDKETLQRLFDPFFTTKFTGRGLGMSAVLGIVQGHKGAIMVQSAVGQGSTIRVLFPASKSIGVTTASDPAGFQLQSGMVALLGTVLVVDDEEGVRGVCAAFAHHLGLQTLTAAHGEEALTLFKRHADEIGCVLLDLTMPRMDGISTFQEMKRFRPDIPVILCSGYNEQEAMQRFTSEGLAGFIQKPYGLEDLKNKIASVLKDRARTPAEEDPIEQ